MDAASRDPDFRVQRAVSGMLCAACLPNAIDWCRESRLLVP
jgi:hypothetical protein